MDITNHPSSDVIHVCNRSHESRIVAFMFTRRQLDGWRGYWDLSTSGNCCQQHSSLSTFHRIESAQTSDEQLCPSRIPEFALGQSIQPLDNLERIVPITRF